jgi:hypothetical protein
MRYKFNSYNVFYKYGGIEMETTVEAPNIKIAWIRAKENLCSGTLATTEDKVNKDTTKITRKYKKDR